MRVRESRADSEIERVRTAAAEVGFWVDKIARESGYRTRRQLDPYVERLAASTLKLLEILG